VSGDVGLVVVLESAFVVEIPVVILDVTTPKSLVVETMAEPVPVAVMVTELELVGFPGLEADEKVELNGETEPKEVLDTLAGLPVPTVEVKVEVETVVLAQVGSPLLGLVLDVLIDIAVVIEDEDPVGPVGPINPVLVLLDESEVPAGNAHTSSALNPQDAHPGVVPN
jgi:hypothetical protein